MSIIPSDGCLCLTQEQCVIAAKVFLGVATLGFIATFILGVLGYNHIMNISPNASFGMIMIGIIPSTIVALALPIYIINKCCCDRYY